MHHDSTPTSSTSSTQPRYAAGRATLYAIRGAAGAWWSEILGRFVHPNEIAEPLDLPLLVSFFDSMIGAITYGVHHDLDARDAGWEAVPFPIVPGFNDQQVQA